MPTETYTPDKLFAGDFDVETSAGTLIAGQNLVRGAVLGKITASGKFNLSLSAAADGSQTPFAILAADCNAAAADQVCSIYLSGTFNQSALTIGAAHTAATIKDGLRDKGIYLKTTVVA
jgi:hypothetical protein